MASTISNINEALVDQKVVGALRYVLARLSSFSYEVTSEGRIINDAIYVPIATDATVGDKTAGTMKTANGTLAGTAVTLNRFRAAGWDAIEGQMRANVLPQYWADKAAGAVYQVAKDLIDTALGLLVKANFGDTDSDKYVTALGDFNQGALAEFIAVAIAKNKQREQSIVLNTQYAMGLLGQSFFGLINAAAGNNVLATGELPPLLGYPAIRYDAFPTNGENLVGAMMGRAALLVAAAPPDQFVAGGQANVIERRIIKDPDSDIAVLYTMTGDGGGKINGEVALLSGVAVGQNSAVLLKSA